MSGGFNIPRLLSAFACKATRSRPCRSACNDVMPDGWLEQRWITKGGLVTTLSDIHTLMDRSAPGCCGRCRARMIHLPLPEIDASEWRTICD
ncbi:hypothetical protein JTE90_014661 [Oedothorax gibbosus]|uniref:Uncharacterized protein n=1 Tax=Oedothorax gibbosus TaxID=931172 RepID=A0AAV6V830_9ARAC|nr:hypothetical protein JTE90_014661 [Oedothorax gibbosus]